MSKKLPRCPSCRTDLEYGSVVRFSAPFLCINCKENLRVSRGYNQLVGYLGLLISGVLCFAFGLRRFSLLLGTMLLWVPIIASVSWWMRQFIAPRLVPYLSRDRESNRRNLFHDRLTLSPLLTHSKAVLVNDGGLGQVSKGEDENLQWFRRFKQPRCPACGQELEYLSVVKSDSVFQCPGCGNKVTVDHKRKKLPAYLGLLFSVLFSFCLGFRSGWLLLATLVFYVPTALSVVWLTSRFSAPRLVKYSPENCPSQKTDKSAC